MATFESGDLTRIHGAKEMETVLKQLPDEIAKRVVRQALRKAALPILEEARRTAPIGRESKGRIRLRRNARGRVSIANRGKLVAELKIVTIRKPASAAAAVAVTVGKAFWGLFQEYGWSRQANPPHKGWFRRAFEAKKQEALAALGRELGDGIERAAKRLAGPLAKSGLKQR